MGDELDEEALAALHERREALLQLLEALRRRGPPPPPGRRQPGRRWGRGKWGVGGWDGVPRALGRGAEQGRGAAGAKARRGRSFGGCGSCVPGVVPAAKDGGTGAKGSCTLVSCNASCSILGLSHLRRSKSQVPAALPIGSGFERWGLHFSEMTRRKSNHSCKFFRVHRVQDVGKSGLQAPDDAPHPNANQQQRAQRVGRCCLGESVPLRRP